MTRPLRITTSIRIPSLILVLAMLLSQACGASPKEVKAASSSGYNTDFATVYGQALSATVELYPHTTENAVTGVIRTAWHPVATQSGSNRQNSQNASSVANNPGASGGGISMLSNTEASDRKRFFIRFRVHVVGGKPWRVRVTGEASEWAAGDVPMSLKGAETPHWLPGRTEALQVAIYRRLQKHAIRLKTAAPVEETTATIEQPTSYAALPKAARKVVAAVHRAVAVRDMGALRQHMAEDLLWSVGNAGSADVAIAMWQADTQIFTALGKVLEGGCTVGDGALTVSCPQAYGSEPNYSGYRAIFEKRAEGWVMTAFVDGV